MTESTSTSGASEVAKVAELAKDIRVAMLTTVDAEGDFVARPMGQQQIEADGDLWFFAERGSRKVAQVLANPHVGVTLTSNDTWISINGTAEVVEDRRRTNDLWNPFVEAWLPQGPDDPSVVLLKVTSRTAEYIDSPGGRVASVLSFVKAKVTGERLEAGDTGRVDMER